jgi:uncharacterized protein (TIGR03083 family)
MADPALPSSAEPSPAVPPQPDPLPFDPIAHLRTDAVRFQEIVADHGVHHEVRACPGWTLGDLAWHLGTVWDRWGRIVADGITDVDGVTALDRPERPADDQSMLEWVTAAHTAMFSALAGAPADQQVWTWTGANRPVSWVARRMTHETTVHRWDAADAVGVPYEVPAAVAADGIDEFLMWFAARRVNPDAEAVAGTVHLHCTDLDDGVVEGADDRSAAIGEWMVTRLDESGIAFTREHAKGDAAVRGRANDLLLWLWRRDAGPVEILGDATVAARFRAFPAL